MRRLRLGDRSSALELFESSCPKFISPLVPDYLAQPVAVNSHQVVFEHQSKVFIDEVMQHIPFIQLRSFLSMYTSVNIAKLARFMELTEADMISLLLAYKHKVSQQKSYRNAEFHFTIEGGVLVVEEDAIKGGGQGQGLGQAMQYERYFTSGVRKHHEIISQLNNTFANVGL
jgi:translation initiation factor 3 subunit L